MIYRQESVCAATDGLDRTASDVSPWGNVPENILVGNLGIETDNMN